MKRPSSPGETTPEPTPDRAGASAALPSRTGSPHDYKYASTRRLGGEHVINQVTRCSQQMSVGHASRVACAASLQTEQRFNCIHLLTLRTNSSRSSCRTAQLSER